MVNILRQEIHSPSKDASNRLTSLLRGSSLEEHVLVTRFYGDEVRARVRVLAERQRMGVADGAVFERVARAELGDVLKRHWTRC